MSDLKDLSALLENLHGSLVEARTAAVLLNHPCAEELADALECIEAACLLCQTNEKGQL